MANSYSALNPDKWKSDVQAWLNSMLVVRDIANMDFREFLRDGDVINWPFVNETRVQAYTVGTDLTIDDTTATQSTLTINQSRAATFQIDYTERAQMMDKGLTAKQSQQSAFVLAQEMDQNVLKEGTDNASSVNDIGSTASPITLTASSIVQRFTEAFTALGRSNALDRPVFAVVDYGTAALITQSEIASTFNLSDAAFKRGYTGGEVVGFKLYVSNNLPTQVNLTMDTNPTAGDTITVHGVTFTFVDPIGSTPGNVLIGVAASNTQANLRAAINGSSGAGTTYVELSAENRRKLQNRQLSCAAFSGNAATLTSFGKIAGTETFTAATNVFGTEVSHLLFGSFGALSVAMQMQPELYIRQEPKQLRDNYITHTLYGKAVFARDAFRLCDMTIVNP